MGVSTEKVAEKLVEVPVTHTPKFMLQLKVRNIRVKIRALVEKLIE